MTKMENLILIGLVLTAWSHTVNSQWQQQSSDTQYPQYSQTYYPYQYNNTSIIQGQYQPIQYPQERAKNTFEASQSFIDQRYDPQYSDLISNSVLELAHKLGTRIESHGGTSNSQIFSPVSIASALTLLLLGSKGQTHQELLQLFDFDQSPLYTSKPYKIHEEFGLMVEDLLENTIHPSRARPQPSWKYTNQNEYLSFRQSQQTTGSTEDDHIIRIANGIFIQDGISLRPDYKTVVQEVYKSEITPLDFRGHGRDAQYYINGWVNEKTHGKIPTIIAEEITSDTSVIIASALYFKTLWEKEFLEGGTTPADFYPEGLNGPSAKIQMMANGGVFPFYDATVEYGCKIIGLPYKKNLSTMYIIMPNDSTRSKLRELQAQLSADKIEYMISRMTRKTAIIAMPRLHIQNSIHLKHVLAELGVRSIFTRGRSDLSLITDRQLGGVQVNTYQQNSNHMTTDAPLIFNRLGEAPDMGMLNITMNRTKRAITYKVESSISQIEPLRLKDFILNKRITKLNPGKKRNRRQIIDHSKSIRILEELRKTTSELADLQDFVDDVIHKVDLIVNERGTEGGAATVAYLRRSGPEVLFRADTPFMILVRHDPTKLPLFYGTVYEPT